MVCSTEACGLNRVPAPAPVSPEVGGAAGSTVLAVARNRMLGSSFLQRGVRQTSESAANRMAMLVPLKAADSPQVLREMLVHFEHSYFVLAKHLPEFFISNNLAAILRVLQVI